MYYIFNANGEKIASIDKAPNTDDLATRNERAILVTNEQAALFDSNHNIDADNNPVSPIIVATIAASTFKKEKATYDLADGEVLMSALPTTTADVAKEDGTWITPAQDYLVYKNVNNVCVLDRDASYLLIEKKYKEDLVNLLIGKAAVEESLKSGLLTEEEANTNFTNLATKRTNILNAADVMKGVVDNALS